MIKNIKKLFKKWFNKTHIRDISDVNSELKRYCVSLMYDDEGCDGEGDYIDYRLESIIVNAESEKIAIILATKTLEHKMRKWKLRVDTALEI